jgi:hypothetical protein
VGIIDGHIDFAVNKAMIRYLIYREVELTVDDPHVYTWEECRRYGLDDGSWPRLIRYCNTECRIRHEFDLRMRRMNDRVMYAISRM